MLRDLDADAQRNGFVAEDAEVRWHSQRQTNIHEVADEYAGPIDIAANAAKSFRLGSGDQMRMIWRFPSSVSVHRARIGSEQKAR